MSLHPIGTRVKVLLGGSLFKDLGTIVKHRRPVVGRPEQWPYAVRMDEDGLIMSLNHDEIEAQPQGDSQ